MSEDSPCGPYLLSGPEFGYIKQIAKQFERDSWMPGKELAVVEFVLRHWEGYRRHVEREFTLDSPRRPHPKFLLTWLYDAKLYYYNEHGKQTGEW